MANPAIKQPTLAEFKRWARDVQPAAKAVLMARVFAEMERARVDAYIRPVFDTYRFIDKRTNEPITDPKWLYLCEDDDLCTNYFEDCDKAHRAHGFTGPQGHCPALIAENLVITVENELIKLAESLTGIEVHNLYGDNRQKYLELLIGACFAKDTAAKGGRS